MQSPLVDRNGALLVAAGKGNAGVVECLLGHGVNVYLCRLGETVLSKRMYKEETPLHEAINRPHRHVIDAFSKRDADVMLKDAKGGTALNVAKNLDEEDVVSCKSLVCIPCLRADLNLAPAYQPVPPQSSMIPWGRNEQQVIHSLSGLVCP